jgi:hypothetical protein
MTQAVALAQYGSTGVSQGFKNRIINGAMVIDQRNAGASVTVGSGAYPVDRWFSVEDTDGAMSAEQVEDAPTGFINSVKLITTTADTNLTTTQTAQFMQNIEGFNVADLGFGSASAKTVTLSFWVKSSLTGTMGGSLRNDAANRSYPFSYTISTADTWEQKSVTIPGDTSGTWLTNNSIGIRLVFSLGAGPSRTGTAGAWNSNNNTAPTGEVPVIGTLNATWQVTGVQLEVGSTATSFDYRPYGTELSLCQRYFVRLINGNGQELSSGWNYNSTQVSGLLYAPVSMRATPSIISSSGSNYYIFYRDNVGDNFNSITIELSNATNNVVSYYNDSEISGTGGQCGLVRSSNASASVALSSEL